MSQKKGRKTRTSWLWRILTSRWSFATLALKVVSAWLFWHFLFSPFQGFAGAERRVVVAPGLSARQILDRLDREGVIASSWLSRAYLVLVLGNRPLKAGEYLFAGPANGPQVLAKLIQGESLERSVTVVEGLSMMETADLLAREGFGERGALLDAMAQVGTIADLDPEATNLEGYLFPDTYSFAPGTPPGEVVRALVANFRARYAREIVPILPRQGAPPLRRLVTLASIVEKEARLQAERTLIAGVYRNRLDQGIGLYADPTVIYALRLAGRWDGNIRREDLAIDSPYNTYRYPGLPPGPIASPGLASLAAAACPAPVRYLYFVSKNDGSHAFAETLDEHNRNVEIWQRRYFRERRNQEAAAR
ncbi:MAG TPA: endolytic transglycosylase MltG [Thermoanaerobaculia bacterium]|nr:endolytic transglycosylase MltG [Thermoanaerobaculia bacterium]